MALVHRYDLGSFAGICAAMLLWVNPVAQGQQGRENWNQFRGPNGQGITKTGRIPIHFGPDRNVLWKIPLPPGQSSPVIWSGRIFLTAYGPTNEKALTTLAIDRQRGRILWRQSVRARSVARLHSMNSPATPCPSREFRPR